MKNPAPWVTALMGSRKDLKKCTTLFSVVRFDEHREEV
jgi:hypothetical protein